jgi:hypothetical protein
MRSWSTGSEYMAARSSALQTYRKTLSLSLPSSLVAKETLLLAVFFLLVVVVVVVRGGGDDDDDVEESPSIPVATASWFAFMAVSDGDDGLEDAAAAAVLLETETFHDGDVMTAASGS